MALTDTSIRMFRYDDAGQTQMLPSAGGLITILDAILLNGYNTKTINSITVDGSFVATVTTSAAHGFRQYDVVRHAGATPVAYNGDFRIQSVPSPTTYTVQLASNPGTPGGTITTKKAPMSDYWTKPFSGTNKAVYRSTDPAGTGMYLRVDDTQSVTYPPTSYAIVRGYESMTDVDTGLGAFQSVSAVAIPAWMKSYQSLYNAPWFAVGDSRLFYLFVGASGSTVIPGAAIATYMFGDIKSVLASDPYGCILNNRSDGQHASYSVPLNEGVSWFALARGYSRLPGFQWAFPYAGPASSGVNTGNNPVYGGSGGSYQLKSPNPVDNRVYISDNVAVVESTGSGNNYRRGSFPGLYAPCCQRPFTDFSFVENFEGLPGRVLWPVPTTGMAGSGWAWGTYAQTQGQLLFDITGPWR